MRSWARSLRVSQRRAAPKPGRRCGGLGGRRGRVGCGIRGGRRHRAAPALCRCEKRSRGAGRSVGLGVGEHEEQSLQGCLGGGELEQLDIGPDQVGDVRREPLARADRDQAALGVGLDRDVGVPLAGDGPRPRVVAGAEQVPGVGGHRAQVGDRAVEGDLAAAHDRDVVADLLDLVHVVRGQQDGQAARRPAA